MYPNFIMHIPKTLIDLFSIRDNYVDVVVVVISPVSIGLVLGLNDTMPVVDLGL